MPHYPYSLPITVAFRDLDALGHVNNAVYLTYFEHARIGYGLRLIGSDSLRDLAFIVAEATVTYLRPAYYGDELEVGARITEIGTKSFVMEYGLWRRADGELIARGRTVQVWYNYAAGRSERVPDAFRAAVARDNARVPPQDAPQS
ncbi:acyl-CoA thioesterase [Kallotenue papyrolyticum]|uniref:acyl-CoA thioesterase n=1 Tax=Kallotenue papyrolyticum TaxID=1325125 RepID=UPI00047865A4|nr:thioesterase family protein [Kallotenue papyrolyticum]